MFSHTAILFCGYSHRHDLMYDTPTRTMQPPSYQRYNQRLTSLGFLCLAPFWLCQRGNMEENRAVQYISVDTMYENSLSEARSLSHVPRPSPGAFQCIPWGDEALLWRGRTLALSSSARPRTAARPEGICPMGPTPNLRRRQQRKKPGMKGTPQRPPSSCTLVLPGLKYEVFILEAHIYNVH